MTIPSEIIQKAIEGGYLGGKSFASYRESSHQIIYEEEDYVLPKLTKSIPEIALDPTFWQSLGKALGWKEWETTAFIYNELTWYYYARQLYCLILIGGDTEAFWAELLAPRNQ